MSCHKPFRLPKSYWESVLTDIYNLDATRQRRYIFWEWAFWGVSIPVCIFGYTTATGHFPDFSNQDDLAKLGAEAFAFVNVARFAVPLRIGLALGTTPWVQENVIDRFQKNKD